MPADSPISLVIPVYNESRTIGDLLDTIAGQTRPPDEVILVDGGSTDDTLTLIQARIATDPRYRIIEAGRAYPGKGRNIGAEAAHFEWIAFTDAGIRLEPHWLQELAQTRNAHPGESVVYGNYAPQQSDFFSKCATIAYVPPAKPGVIRGQSVVSCLLKKEAWQKAGGFPNWRASEDLVFMDELSKAGYTATFAPLAMARWQLQPTLVATYRKFKLYSAYNVWAGRQAYWHYGVLRHYLVMSVFLMAAVFLHPLAALLIPGWMLLRALKRGYDHRHEFGPAAYLNPLVVGMVALITAVIDLATFTGWFKALFQKNPLKKAEQ